MIPVFILIFFWFIPCLAIHECLQDWQSGQHQPNAVVHLLTIENCNVRNGFSTHNCFAFVCDKTINSSYSITCKNSHSTFQFTLQPKTTHYSLFISEYNKHNVCVSHSFVEYHSRDIPKNQTISLTSGVTLQIQIINVGIPFWFYIVIGVIICVVAAAWKKHDDRPISKLTGRPIN